MPFMTLHVMMAPATNAVGRPGIAARTAVIGSLIMPLAFYAGVMLDGTRGVALGWLAGYPLLTAIAAQLSMPAIGIGWRDLGGALRAPVLAGLAMAMAVAGLDASFGTVAPLARLAMLGATGAAVYGGLMALFARERLSEVLSLAFRR
jgi:hypothetical protein